MNAVELSQNQIESNTETVAPPLFYRPDADDQRTFARAALFVGGGGTGHYAACRRAIFAEFRGT